jgi:hypothetical protein
MLLSNSRPTSFKKTKPKKITQVPKMSEKFQKCKKMFQKTKEMNE